MVKEKELRQRLRVIEGGKGRQKGVTALESERILNQKIAETAQKIIDAATTSVEEYKQGKWDVARQTLQNAEAAFNEFKKEHKDRKALIRKIDNAIKTAKGIMDIE